MNHEHGNAQGEPVSCETDSVAKHIVDAAYTIHSTLGPGLLENIYETCLAYELRKRELKVDRQITLPVFYDDMKLDAGLRLDLVVNDCVVVEVKAVDSIIAVHKAQLLTYLKLTGHRLGLLINFNVPVIKNGICRIVL